VFGGSLVATVNRAPYEVQTGGFGDVNGFPGGVQDGSRGNVTKLGSFDLPLGPRVGNGSGGSQGVRGTVMSTVFGDGMASPGGAGVASRGTLRQGGFGDMNSSSQATEKRLRAAPAPEREPVEILAKPNPSYTEEARRLRVEGEVLLDVVFSASGELRVVGMIRGLGHGLDEAARRAAEQIRFKPARREGQPIDCSATLRIVFQLAY
jgi:TonB family protein